MKLASEPSEGSYTATMKGLTSYASLCASKSATQVRMAVRPKYRSAHDSGEKEVDSGKTEADSGGGYKKKETNPRKIMVVVDGSRESVSALHWALAHAIRPSDTLVLVGICKNAEGLSQFKDVGEENDVVQAMKDLCCSHKPQVRVEISLVEESEKGPNIVEEARKQEASLLILGQKKRNFTRRLLANWTREEEMFGDGLVDYCIQNAHCMSIAVRKREGNVGGYLLTTKKLKDFWLLA